MIYLLHPDAVSELRDAALHYKKRANATVAQAFLVEFEKSIHLLLEYPLLGAFWIYGKRRLVMQRFPYSIVYTVADQELRILAVAHHSRLPNYWRKRKW